MYVTAVGISEIEAKGFVMRKHGEHRIPAILKGIVDSGGAIAVRVIGIFGVVWVRKQQERYHYWQSIALQYQEELTQIVPLLKSRDAHEKHAENFAAEEVGPILARRIHERHLWVTLHVIVVILGLGLFLISLSGIVM